MCKKKLYASTTEANTILIDVKAIANEPYRRLSKNYLNDIEKGDKSSRIIIHSMMKTSTTSMGKALKLIGKGEYDHGWRPDLGNKYSSTIDAANCLVRDTKSIHSVSENNKLAIKIMFKNMVCELGDCTIFSDFPIGHIRINPFVKKIIFPNSKFIWIDRGIDGWLESVKNWQLSHPNVFKQAEKIWSNEEEAKKKLIKSYSLEKARIVNLKKDFPQDVLITKISSGWTDICRFLNCAVPKEEFPHINKSTPSS